MSKRNVEIDDLIARISTYMTESEIDEVKECYEYTKEKFFGMKRLTKDDYIYHLLNVAYILTDIDADKETVWPRCTCWFRLLTFT